MRLGRIQNNYTAEGFDEVVANGLDFIEICTNDDAESQQLIDAKESVKAQIARTGIDISSVGRWNHHVQENGALNQENIQLYYALMDTAIELGAKTFVCGCNYDETVSLYRNYTNAIEFFRLLLSHAAGKIKVAIHNCEWNNFIVSPKQWEVVLGELPDLYIKFDASHPYNRGEDYLAQLSDFGDRIAHLHIKGTTHAGSKPVSDPPAGMDDLQWGSIFSILYARGYDGDLSIEPHSGDWNGEKKDFGIQLTKKLLGPYIIR